MSSNAAEIAAGQAKATLTAQTEKPIHYTYLKEFRVEQCPQFLQHKCTQHKPFTCFHWHFMNQRRRRPIRDPKTKSFNYSPDVYCTKYDETTGICPDSDECPFLHRTAGDTERRYHLRYYKTGICVYDTDARGHCVKNGPHCAFAHGLHDLRNPVYDIREIQGKILSEDGSEIDANGVLVPNLDKDRNAVSEDPRWQDTNYVLGNYKTEQCKRPPRLCRQGYACPQYHNSRDKRRPPQKFKYRSTPCPNVKQGDEWGDPAHCDSGDQCTYCHTRTEQQFHPEIYKSTKCNDMQQTSFCPRGPFCAFAHVDKEMSAVREVGSDATNLATILSNVLPQSPSPGANKPENGQVMAPIGPDLVAFNSMGPIGRPRSYSTSHAAAVQHHLQLKTMESALPHYQKAPGCEREEHNAMRKHRAKTMDGSAKEWASIAGSYSFPNTVESVVNKALDDLNLEEIDVEACLDKDLVEECSNSNPMASSLNQALVSSGFIPNPNGLPNPNGIPNSQPVNIPGRDRPASPPNSMGGSIDKSATAFYGSPFNAAGFGGVGYSGVGAVQPSQSPSTRLWETTQGPNGHLTNWSDTQLAQIRAVCEAYKSQAEEASRREKVAEQQRDDALRELQKLQVDIQQRPFGLRSVDLDQLSPQQIRVLQEQLRSDLDALDKVSHLHQQQQQQQQHQQDRLRMGLQMGAHHLPDRDFWTPPGRGHC